MIGSSGAACAGFFFRLFSIIGLVKVNLAVRNICFCVGLCAAISGTQSSRNHLC